MFTINKKTEIFYCLKIKIKNLFTYAALGR